MALVGVQIKGNAALRDVVGAAQVFETGKRVAPGNNGARVLKPQALPEGALAQRSRRVYNSSRRPC